MQNKKMFMFIVTGADALMCGQYSDDGGTRDGIDRLYSINLT